MLVDGQGEDYVAIEDSNDGPQLTLRAPAGQRIHQHIDPIGRWSMLQRLMIAMILGLALAGCGSTTSERALSGAGVGAAVGAGGAAVTGGSIGSGAVIGGAVGAAAGALTDESQIDLDD